MPATTDKIGGDASSGRKDEGVQIDIAFRPGLAADLNAILDIGVCVEPDKAVDSAESENEPIVVARHLGEAVQALPV